MKWITSHVTRCLLAGIVALLPIGGFVVTVVYLESMISGSWLAGQAWYFPGLGLIAATAAIYLIGLTVSTFIGRCAWSLVDRVLNGLPMLGRLYQTLKQIVGYGDGKDGIFQEVVFVHGGRTEGNELGFVTNELRDEAGARQLVVFVPDAPNPTTGRLVLIDAADVQPVPMPVHEALRVLVSVGKMPLAVTPAGR